MVRRAQRGVTYLALLFAVAATSAALAATATLWTRTLQRERETQLLWAGEQIRRAIVAYARHAGDEAGRYPRTLQDLLLDPRSVAPRRFLRRIHDDPMTGGTDWALIRDPQGRIVGVHSRATRAPVKRAGFHPDFAHFAQARSYADWEFVAGPARPRLAPPEARAASAAARQPGPPAPTSGAASAPPADAAAEVPETPPASADEAPPEPEAPDRR